MANLIEDYREIDNIRETLDSLVESVTTAPRRVFLTRKGEVLAVIIGPKDYEDLWNIELDRDIKVSNEDVANGEVLYTHEEFLQHVSELEAKLRAQK